MGFASYSDVILVFVIGFIGTLVILIGVGAMAVRKLSEPKRELLQKIDNLEKEIKSIKNKK